MNKMKKFFTLDRHHAEGFTLVELIVVIAILAILGAVAVPAYSGYIEKTKKAADEQLLADLNTAFASACAINGEDHYNRKDVTVQMNDVDGGKEVVITVSDIAKFEEQFNGFYEGGVFQVFEELFYDKTLGRIYNDSVVTFKFGDVTISLSAKDIAILSGDNAFSDRGAAALLGDVGTLQTYLAGGFIGSEILDEIGNSDEFFTATGSYLGLKREDYADDEAYRAAVGAKLESLGNEDAATNALIMYAASNAANSSDADIEKLFTGSVTGNIAVMKKDAEGNTVRDNEATMANAALAYGMYTAYAQRNGLDTTQPGNDFVNVVGTDEFKAYIKDDAGKADLEAYRAAMNMISDNTDKPEITGSIMENGIVGNSNLENLMTDVMDS